MRCPFPSRSRGWGAEAPGRVGEPVARSCSLQSPPAEGQRHRHGPVTVEAAVRSAALPSHERPV